VSDDAETDPPVERFGPEWWALYAAAWDRRWSTAKIEHERSERSVDHFDHRVLQKPNGMAVAIMCKQDADEGVEAFNAMTTEMAHSAFGGAPTR